MSTQVRLGWLITAKGSKDVCDMCCCQIWQMVLILGSFTTECALRIHGQSDWRCVTVCVLPSLREEEREAVVKTRPSKSSSLLSEPFPSCRGSSIFDRPAAPT